MRSLIFAATLVLITHAAEAQEAPKKAPLWRRCEDALPWRFAARVPNSESRLLELASKGAFARYSAAWIRAEIARAPAMDALLKEAGTQRKLLLWYVPSVEGQHMILPHFLDRYMSIALFSDPELLALIQRRYLPLKLPAGGALGKRYGLVAPGFVEPGLLVLSPSGKVLHKMNRINSFNADFFLHLLGDIARRHPKLSDARLEEGAAPLAFARDAIQAGEDQAAEAALQTLGDAEALLLRARIARRRRDGAAALALLARIKGSRAEEAATERGRVLVKLGRFDEAAAALAGSKSAEAAYWLGVARRFGSEKERATEAWALAVRRDPTSIWAARADANRRVGSDGNRGEGPLTRSMEDPRWLAAEAYAVRADTQWRREPAEAEDVARRALSFLRLQQEADGSWGGSRWGGGGERSASAENIRIAITAACASALHAHRARDPAGIEKALSKADAALLEPGRVQASGPSIWIYADGLRLRYFARRLADFLTTKKRAEVKARMQAWVDRLLAHQGANKGAFKHYSYASSFAIAAAIDWLTCARGAGLVVPDAALSEACEALEAMRGPGGFYGYLTANPKVTRGPLGAGSRAPLCALALDLTGSRQDLPGAVARYLASYRASAERARKTNFHNPSLGQTAGYYFFHNFTYACRADRRGGGKHRSALLALLCELPELDGAFIDAGFSYGKSYSTAMALLAFEALGLQEKR